VLFFMKRYDSTIWKDWDRRFTRLFYSARRGRSIQIILLPSVLEYGVLRVISYCGYKVSAEYKHST